MNLTSGKIRGLQNASNDRQILTILAIDHGRSLAQTINSIDPDAVTAEEMTALKGRLVTALSPYASAILVDPVYGLDPAAAGRPDDSGLIVAVEDGDYASVERPARRLAGWSVGRAKAAGADAIKCFFYYHPEDVEVAAHQEQFVRALVDDCALQDVPLFAEPLTYGTDSKTRPDVVIETARRVSRWGIDVLKVEFPVDAGTDPDEDAWFDACRALSDACVVPWALLSAGVDFDTFARQVEVACRAGASGYLAGRAIWKEGVSLTGGKQAQFWEMVAAPRLQTLADIAATFGRPWPDTINLG